MEDNIINVTVVDREGIEHQLLAPTDMAMNMMEVCKSYDLSVEGTCRGMALCASCHMYILSDHTLSEASGDEENMLSRLYHSIDNPGYKILIKSLYTKDT